MRETRHLYVRNLPESINEVHLISEFERYGRVEKVRILPKKEGTTGIAAFVDFLDMKSAQKAQGSHVRIGEKDIRTDFNDRSGVNQQLKDGDFAGGPNMGFSGSYGRGGGGYRPNYQGGGRGDFRPRGGYQGGGGFISRGGYQGRGGGFQGRGHHRQGGSFYGDNQDGGNLYQSYRGSHNSSNRSNDGGRTRYRSASSDSSGSDLHDKSNDAEKVTCLLVRNLPERIPDKTVQDGLFYEFKKVGKIASMKVEREGQEKRCLVQFRANDDLDNALDVMQGKMFQGSRLELTIIETANFSHSGSAGLGRSEHPLSDPDHIRASRTLFVGMGNQRNTTEEEIYRHFERFGTIVTIDIKRQNENNSVFAFIQFSDIMSVCNSISKMDGAIINETKVKLGFGKSMSSPVLWVDNVQDHIKKGFLQQQFERFGKVRMTIIDRITKQALIYYDEIGMASDAMFNMRGRNVANCRLRVDYYSRAAQDIFTEQMSKSGQKVPDLDQFRRKMRLNNGYYNEESKTDWRPQPNAVDGSSYPRHWKDSQDGRRSREASRHFNRNNDDDSDSLERSRPLNRHLDNSDDSDSFIKELSDYKKKNKKYKSVGGYLDDVSSDEEVVPKKKTKKRRRQSPSVSNSEDSDERALQRLQAELEKKKKKLAAKKRAAMKVAKDSDNDTSDDSSDAPARLPKKSKKKKLLIRKSSKKAKKRRKRDSYCASSDSLPVTKATSRTGIEDISSDSTVAQLMKLNGSAEDGEYQSSTCSVEITPENVATRKWHSSSSSEDDVIGTSRKASGRSSKKSSRRSENTSTSKSKGGKSYKSSTKSSAQHRINSIIGQYDDSVDEENQPYEPGMILMDNKGATSGTSFTPLLPSERGVAVASIQVPVAQYSPIDESGFMTPELGKNPQEENSPMDIDKQSPHSPDKSELVNSEDDELVDYINLKPTTPVCPPDDAKPVLDDPRIVKKPYQSIEDMSIFGGTLITQGLPPIIIPLDPLVDDEPLPAATRRKPKVEKVSSSVEVSPDVLPRDPRLRKSSTDVVAAVLPNEPSYSILDEVAISINERYKRMREAVEAQAASVTNPPEIPLTRPIESPPENRGSDIKEEWRKLGRIKKKEASSAAAMDGSNSDRNDGSKLPVALKSDIFDQDCERLIESQKVLSKISDEDIKFDLEQELKMYENTDTGVEMTSGFLKPLFPKTILETPLVEEEKESVVDVAAQDDVVAVSSVEISPDVLPRDPSVRKCSTEVVAAVLPNEPSYSIVDEVAISINERYKRMREAVDAQASPVTNVTEEVEAEVSAIDKGDSDMALSLPLDTKAVDVVDAVVANNNKEVPAATDDQASTDRDLDLTLSTECPSTDQIVAASIASPLTSPETAPPHLEPSPDIAEDPTPVDDVTKPFLAISKVTVAPDVASATNKETLKQLLVGPGAESRPLKSSLKKGSMFDDLTLNAPNPQTNVDDALPSQGALQSPERVGAILQGVPSSAAETVFSPDPAVVSTSPQRASLAHGTATKTPVYASQGSIPSPKWTSSPNRGGQSVPRGGLVPQVEITRLPCYISKTATTHDLGKAKRSPCRRDSLSSNGRIGSPRKDLSPRKDVSLKRHDLSRKGLSLKNCQPYAVENSPVKDLSDEKDGSMWRDYMPFKQQDQKLAADIKCERLDWPGSAGVEPQDSCGFNEDRNSGRRDCDSSIPFKEKQERGVQYARPLKRRRLVEKSDHHDSVVYALSSDDPTSKGRGGAMRKSHGNSLFEKDSLNLKIQTSKEKAPIGAAKQPRPSPLDLLSSKYDVESPEEESEEQYLSFIKDAKKGRTRRDGCKRKLTSLKKTKKQANVIENITESTVETIVGSKTVKCKKVKRTIESTEERVISVKKIDHKKKSIFRSDSESACDLPKSQKRKKGSFKQRTSKKHKKRQEAPPEDDESGDTDVYGFEDKPDSKAGRNFKGVDRMGGDPKEEQPQVAKEDICVKEEAVSVVDSCDLTMKQERASVDAKVLASSVPFRKPSVSPHDASSIAIVHQGPIKNRIKQEYCRNQELKYQESLDLSVQPADTTAKSDSPSPCSTNCDFDKEKQAFLPLYPQPSAYVTMASHQADLGTITRVANMAYPPHRDEMGISHPANQPHLVMHPYSYHIPANYPRLIRYDGYPMFPMGIQHTSTSDSSELLQHLIKRSPTPVSIATPMTVLDPVIRSITPCDTPAQSGLVGGPAPSAPGVIRAVEEKVDCAEQQIVQVANPAVAGHSILHNYPNVWQGNLVLKNDSCYLQLNHVHGNVELITHVLNQVKCLNIFQRMRLETAQLDGVARMMQVESEYALLLGLPCGANAQERTDQGNLLKIGFIEYLQQKQAAGIVNCKEIGDSQSQLVMHIFPPCYFTSGHLAKHARDIHVRLADYPYLVFIVAMTSV